MSLTLVTSGNPPGISPLSQDLADAQVGVYKRYAVNKTAPVRLAQIAIEYWLRPEHHELQGDILWVASMTLIFHAQYSRDRAQSDDLMLTLGEVLNVVMDGIQDP
ncbi:unnamed protein product, partial [Clonostachys chloroleuca]